MESYVRNCFVLSRNGERLFHATGEQLIASLDGYAIVPIEDYIKLLPAETAAKLQVLLPHSGPTDPPEVIMDSNVSTSPMKIGDGKRVPQ